MPTVSFIYKIEEENQVYIGKCIFEYIDEFETDDIVEEVRKCLIEGLNKYRVKYLFPRINSENITDIKLMSIKEGGGPKQTEINSYSYYCVENKIGKKKMYVKGELVSV